MATGLLVSRGIEVDDTVEGPGGPYPVVDRIQDRFACGAVEVETLERQERAAPTTR
jgi:hypothetical protein